jgi:hypothetical protein
MKRALLLLPLFALAACETLPTPGPAKPGGRAGGGDEFAWSTQAGRGSVTGRAVVARYGRSWTCAGQSVALMPETPSTRTRMQNLYGSTQHAVRTVAQVRGKTAGGRDPGQYVRTTRCDANGRFAFRDLPEGGWFVIARIMPAGAADADRALVTMERVATRGGRSVSVKLGE